MPDALASLDCSLLSEIKRPPRYFAGGLRCGSNPLIFSVGPNAQLRQDSPTPDDQPAPDNEDQTEGCAQSAN